MAVAQKIRCRVERLVNHGDHVYTVELAPERRVPQFRPGQFLHLALDEYDPAGFWPESRVFSIASGPAQRDRLRISYSVRGRFTARMERELEVGRLVWIKLPYGEFIVRDTQDVVLFAGGTGITAFTAFLDNLTPEFRHNVYLAYGARNRDLLIYRDLIEAQRRTLPFLHTSYFIERAGGGQRVEVDGLGANETIGRLSVESIWPRIRSPLNAIYYLSGPPVMLTTLSQNLRAHGVNPAATRVDAWE
ncbi:MAG: FAD-dependent oxidoreductase [Chloroflexi bacterium]|nr:FAD-dependent oxidoreductase [Candidatus Marsarchaeota archaeon]MCL5951013.1 FAD-dependent oxidoreductase [Chloroflexota bacterium]